VALGSWVVGERELSRNLVKESVFESRATGRTQG